MIGKEYLILEELKGKDLHATGYINKTLFTNIIEKTK